MIKKMLKIIIILMILMSLSCCNNQTANNINDDIGLEFNKIEELKGKKIGILTGSVYDLATKKWLPDETYSYFNSVSDLVSAMQTNKIDAFVTDENIIRELIKDNPDLGYIDEVVAEIDAAAMFNKDSDNKLLNEFNEFIKESDENGLKEELKKKWENYNEDTTILDYESFKNINGFVKVSVFPESIPYSFFLTIWMKVIYMKKEVLKKSLIILKKKRLDNLYKDQKY